MKPVYNNFDGLEISFQCAVSQHILIQLKIAKEKAQNERNEIPATLGENNNFNVMVTESGCRGGYHYTFKTGEDGEVWFVADNNKTDSWNVRVSVNSLNLALNGYEKTKEKILDILYNKLKAIGADSDFLDNSIKERVSRFDYCMDFETDFFEPEIKNIIAHSRSRKQAYCISDDKFTYTAKGKFIESIRIGTMPNRQVAIYNKTKEIISSKKKYWWKLWNIKKEEFKGQIWRVEIRAGKKELNSWSIKKFKDFEKKAGDVILDILNNIRYAKPNLNNENRSAWKNEEFWDEAINIVKSKLFKYISNATREEILEGIKNDKIEAIYKNISGSFTSLSALVSDDAGKIPEVIGSFTSKIFDDHEKNGKKIEKKFQKSVNKYKLLK